MATQTLPQMFPNAHGFDVYGSHFTNVQGGMHIHPTPPQLTGPTMVSTAEATQVQASTSPPQVPIFSAGGRYSSQLLHEGRGYPMYSPAPQRTLPAEYRTRGIAIGDVGRITPEGVFDFFFNIYLLANNPINVNAPPGFVPLSPYNPSHVIYEDFGPGDYVSTPSVQEINGDFSGATPGGHFLFDCSAPNGAVLALPHGARLQKLENIASMRRYAEKNAESWYRHINGERGLGRELANGGLHLITGCEKAESWGIATFQDVPPQNEFQLSFSPTADAGAGYRYRWQGSRFRHKHADAPPVHGTPLNQTTFIHAFTISLGEGLWGKLFGKVEISPLTDAWTSSGKLGTGFVPFGSQGSSWFSVSFFGSGATPGGKQCGSFAPVDEPCILSDAAPVPKVFHPSQIIHDRILREVPQAKVIITHDDDWRDVFMDDEARMAGQYPLELQQAIFDRFDIMEEDGAAFLVARPAFMPPKGGILGIQDTDLCHAPQLSIEIDRSDLTISSHANAEDVKKHTKDSGRPISPECSVDEHIHRRSHGAIQSHNKPHHLLRSGFTLAYLKVLKQLALRDDRIQQRIIIVGNQSAGKSSIIEALRTLKLPHGAGTVTKCPTEFRLEHPAAAFPSLSIDTTFHSGSSRENDSGKIGMAIQNLKGYDGKQHRCPQLQLLPLTRLEDPVARTEAATALTEETAARIEGKADQPIDSARKEELQKWFRIVDMREKQRSTHALRHNDTGRWFLEDTKFAKWKEQPGLLWIRGNSGTGKSVLSSIVIDHLFDYRPVKVANSHPATLNLGVAYFYFDFRDEKEQLLENMLGSIIMQLSEQSPTPYSVLDQQFKSCHSQLLPTYDDLPTMLKTISTRFAGTYIVLDALDECSEPVHLLVASPPHRIFMETPGFEGASAVALEPIADISVTHTTDIRRLVTSEINLKYKLEHPARCAGDVALKVIEMSHGMFRMAAALLSELTRSSAVPDLGTIPTWRPNELSGFYSRFLEAIGEGGQSFLRHGVGPDKRGEPRRIMLHCAARSGHTDIVYLLLDHGPDVNSAGRNFCSALHLPSEKIVRLLINLGADVNARSGFAYSMLQDVALYDQVNTVRLFEHCANVNAAGASGGGFDGSALQSAAQNGRVDVVRVLFEHGAAVNRVDVSSSVVRSAARRRRRHTGTVRVLFQHGADVKRVDGISGSVLQDAALNGHVDIVCVLLKKGADVHTVDCDGSSALQDAARNGHVGIVCLLLDHDADVSIVGGDFGSALEAASAGGHEEIVKLLREHGAHKGELDGK